MNISSETYWSLPDGVDGRTFADLADEAEALLRDAVRLRERVNTDLTLYLSGGLDSAILQALVKAPRVYCLDFPEEPCYDLAVAAAQGAHVERVTFGIEDARKALPKIAWHLDTPATWSALGQWFLAERVARDAGKVILTGEGADELFLGYSRYRVLWWIDRMRRDPALSGYAALVLRMLSIDDDDELLARMLDRGETDESFAHARSLVERFGGEGDLARRMARVDWHTTMQVLLRMADRMTSAFSLENRSPFLDVRLIEFASRLPTDVLITEYESKALLREVARRVGVPAAVVDAKHKRGMVVPWNTWTKDRGYERRGFAVEMRGAWRAAFGLATCASSL